MLCPHCQNHIPDHSVQCPVCGQHQQSGPAQYGTQYNASAPPRGDLQTYLVPAILVTLFCCQPLGIVAIVFAALAHSKQSEGNIVGAQGMADKAKLCCILSLVLGLLANAVFFFLFFIAAAAGGAH